MARPIRTIILVAVVAALSGCAHGPWLHGQGGMMDRHDGDHRTQMQAMHAQMMQGMHAMRDNKGMPMMGGGCMGGMDHAEPAAPK